jgi:hypothetical protein
MSMKRIITFNLTTNQKTTSTRSYWEGSDANTAVGWAVFPPNYLSEFTATNGVAKTAGPGHLGSTHENASKLLLSIMDCFCGYLAVQ